MKAQVVFFLLLCFFALASSEKRALNIVGGQPAIANQFPFQIFVVVSGGSGSFQCGGFLIDSLHVGTAGHCFDSNPTSVFTQGGTINTTDQSTGQVRNAASWVVHPQYNGTTFDFDAAIITLATPYTVDGVTVKVATLATSQPAPGTTVYVSGWGKTSTAGPTSNFLLFVDVPYVNFTSCKANFWSTIIKGVSVCAGGVGGKDTCQGDSGGALFTTSNINNPIDAQVIGIVSFGDAAGCATTTPTVYSDVPGFAAAFFQQVISGTSPSGSLSQAVSSIAPSAAAASSGPPSVLGSSQSLSPVASSVGRTSVAGSSVGRTSVAGSSVGRSSAAASSQVVAVSSSGAVLPSSSASGAVVASSGAVASSQVVVNSSPAAASSTGVAGQSQSVTQTGTQSDTSSLAAASSSKAAANSSPVAASSKQHSNKTPTGVAAVTCRALCQKTFRSCKKTTRRLKICKQAKKACVSQCGVINPNN